MPILGLKFEKSEESEAPRIEPQSSPDEADASADNAASLHPDSQSTNVRCPNCHRWMFEVIGGTPFCLRLRCQGCRRCFFIQYTGQELILREWHDTQYRA